MLSEVVLKHLYDSFLDKQVFNRTPKPAKVSKTIVTVFEEGFCSDVSPGLTGHFAIISDPYSDGKKVAVLERSQLARHKRYKSFFYAQELRANLNVLKTRIENKPEEKISQIALAMLQRHIGE